MTDFVTERHNQGIDNLVCLFGNLLVILRSRSIRELRTSIKESPGSLLLVVPFILLGMCLNRVQILQKHRLASSARLFHSSLSLSRLAATAGFLPLLPLVLIGALVLVTRKILPNLSSLFPTR